jgi:hypothetical protein
MTSVLIRPPYIFTATSFATSDSLLAEGTRLRRMRFVRRCAYKQFADNEINAGRCRRTATFKKREASTATEASSHDILFLNSGDSGIG